MLWRNNILENYKFCSSSPSTKPKLARPLATIFTAIANLAALDRNAERIHLSAAYLYKFNLIAHGTACTLGQRTRTNPATLLEAFRRAFHSTGLDRR